MRIILCIALMTFFIGLNVPALAGFVMTEGVIQKPAISAPLPDAPLLSTPKESITITTSIPVKVVSLPTTNGIIEKPVVIQQQSVTPLLQNTVENIVIAKSEPAQFVYRPISEGRPLIEPARPSMVIRNDYFKSEAEARILTEPIRIITSNGIYGAPVPEPGSLVGLSAGLFGLLFQVRRIRKRS